MYIAMESEIISRENVKPFSPTPPHLKYHSLSLLDQISPTFLFPLVVYFPAAEHAKSCTTISEKSQILKHSLSIVLTRFYPLAGRIKDDYLSVDCNDEGVLFIVTKFNYSLLDFLKKPDPFSTRHHIPGQPSSVWADPTPTGDVAMIQINHFKCGGMAIGLLFSHSVIDGTTGVEFLKAWADTIRGCTEDNISYPNYNVAKGFFPQNVSLQKESRLFLVLKNRYLTNGKTAMRRYVFDASAISKLKDETVISPTDKCPIFTRVEIVSAFIWKCFMVASIANNKKQISLVRPVVDMRRRAPFPEHCFGNFIWAASASCKNQYDVDLKHLVGKIRNAIGKIDRDFIEKMKGCENFPGFYKNVEETLDAFPGNADCLVFSSWCNFGLYDIDFELGKPVWVIRGDAGSDSEISFVNQVWLMDTRHGDGIEAWVTLDEQYMASFDNNQELRAMASIDPCPLEHGIVAP